MSDDKESKEQSKLALKRWGSPARKENTFGLIAQVAATCGWIMLAFGVGQVVGAAANANVANSGFFLCISGIALRAFSTLLAEEWLSRSGASIVSEARSEVLKTLADTGPSWLMGVSFGARVSQIIDRTQQLHGHAARWLPGIRLALIAPVIVLIAVATQSWLAATLLFVSVLVLPVFIWLTASGTAAEARAQQAALDHLSGVFQARAAHSGLIRAFRAVTRETGLIAQKAETLRRRTLSILRVAFLSTAVLEFFTSISIALVAVYIGFKLLGVFPFATGETLTLEEGIIALLLAPEFFAPIRKLSTLHHDRADAAAAADFLSGWLNNRPQGIERIARLAQPPLIRFQNAALTWPNKTIGAEHISFEAKPNQITALSGPSGSGKSTVLLALLGYTRCSNGCIRVNNDSLEPGKSLAESAAYIGQSPWLMETSIFDNIAIARPDADECEVEAAAKAVGLLDKSKDPQSQLRRKLARFGSGLSGGQRQRVALARAILKQAPILLLDEPAAHLDAQAEQDFIDLLTSLKTGRTIILATHSQALKAAADQTVEIAIKPEANQNV